MRCVSLRAGEVAGQVEALHRGGRAGAGAREQGRRHVDQARGHAAHLGRREPLALAPLHEQRHVDLLLVEREPVPEAAVIEELLAVVGDQRDHRVVVEAERLELREQLPKFPSRYAISPW